MMDGEKAFDIFEEMYAREMEQDGKVDGYHLFYVNCTTSKWNKTEASWDQHCQLKDWKHPKTKGKSSSSHSSEEKKRKSSSDSKEEKNKKSSSDSSEEKKRKSRSDRKEERHSEKSEEETPHSDFLKDQQADPQPKEGRRLENRRKRHQEPQKETIQEPKLENHRRRVKCHHRHHHCRKHQIAFIINNHCFILSKPQRHHHRHHWHHPGFCPYIALLRSIHLLSAIWVIVLIAACIRKRCHKKKLSKLFKKLIKLENKDGNEIYFMLHKGIREVEVHIKTEQDQAPSFQNVMPPQRAPQQTHLPQTNRMRFYNNPPQSYRRVDLRQGRVQDDSLLSRNISFGE